MNAAIIEEMIRLIADNGEQVALGEALDAIHTALGAHSKFEQLVRTTRDQVRNAKG